MHPFECGDKTHGVTLRSADFGDLHQTFEIKPLKSKYLGYSYTQGELSTPH